MSSLKFFAYLWKQSETSNMLCCYWLILLNQIAIQVHESTRLDTYTHSIVLIYALGVDHVGVYGIRYTLYNLLSATDDIQVM